MMVDRSRGRSHEEQWIQPNANSVVVTGLYTHVLHLSHVYLNKDFLGWFTIHPSVFEHGPTLKLKLPEDPDEDTTAYLIEDEHPYDNECIDEPDWD